MIKQLFIGIIILLSLFATTNVALSYGQEIASQTCSSTCGSNTVDCCSNEENNNQELENTCSGNCNGSTCQQSTIKFQLFIPSVDNMTTPPSLMERVTSYETVSHLQTGFKTIWLLPKIG